MSVSVKQSPYERKPGGFAVYRGSGEYLSSFHVCGAVEKTIEVVHFGSLAIAASLHRDEAVRACHAARRVGVESWVVRHPVGALS